MELGGRLILINAVLGSLPTYVTSMFPIPAGVVDKLDMLRRDFLWKGDRRVTVFIWWNGMMFNLIRNQGVLVSETSNYTILVYWWSGYGDTLMKIRGVQNRTVTSKSTAKLTYWLIGYTVGNRINILKLTAYWCGRQVTQFFY